MGAEETSYIRNAAGLIVYQDKNAEFLKLRILDAVQDLKISFCMQKFILFCAPPPQFWPVLPHFVRYGDGTGVTLCVFVITTATIAISSFAEAPDEN